MSQGRDSPSIVEARPGTGGTLGGETITDAKGGRRKRYSDDPVMTPYGKLESLHQARQVLERSITILEFDAQAGTLGNNEAAWCRNQARALLFKNHL
jgi:hypothetical protein